MFDDNRMVEGLVARIKQIERMQENSTKLSKEITKAGKNLDAKSIIEAVTSITNGVQMNMVYQDEFLDLRAETGGLLHTINSLDAFKKNQEEKQTTDHYQIVKNVHALQEIQLRQDAEHSEFYREKAKIEGKVDYEVF